MTIPAEEAAHALRDAQAAAGRSLQARGYQGASGYLIVWGVIWALANGVGQANPHAGQIAWMVLALIGVAISMRIGRGQGSRTAEGAARALLIAAAIGGFGFAVQVVAPPLSFAQADAVATLAVGAVYVATGATAGWRLSAVGAVVMIATVAGWLAARDWFFLWTAVVGGGSLILGGLWFRKA